MKTKSLKLLRIGVLILAWFLISSVLVGIWSRVVGYGQAQNDLTGYMGVMAGEFNVENTFSSLFSGLGNAFFAFLIAAVVRMILKKAPVAIEYANRLMIVCCLFYLAGALIRFYDLIHGLLLTRRLVPGFVWGMLAPYPLLAIPAITPLLYAASIYVLYRHFTDMVQFESEVA